MNIIQFTGNVGSAEMREVNGKDVLNFSVAVRQGISRDAKTEWYRCAIWGQRAASLSQYVTKGAKVCVSGNFEIGEYNGKPQFNVQVSEIDPFCNGKGGETRQTDNVSSARGSATSSDDSGYDDLSDDVPFVSCSPHLEGRLG